MLKRWKTNFLSKDEFSPLKKSLEVFISNKSSVVFTPDNTGANWLGVKNATLSMYPENTFVFPQIYSQPKLSPSQLTDLKEIVSKNEVKLVIFSGAPPYVLNWIREFHSAKIECGIIFHGGLAEMSYSEENRKTMKSVINLGKEGVISRFGIVKEGLNEWLRKNTESDIYRVLPTLSIPKNIKSSKFEDGKIHIGIFGNSTYNKNRHTQVVAASLIENSIIHVMEPNEFNYAVPNERIITHKNLNREDFLSLLSKMDVNLYCSFSESWGQVVLESLALNTPCLYSNNSGISKIIGNSKFEVIEYDNPFAIYQGIKKALESNDTEFKTESFNEVVKTLNNKILED